MVNDPDTASRLALATHELLENATKYSSDGETALSVDFDFSSGMVRVRARNRATRARIAALQKAFEEISSAANAETLYAELLRRTAVSATGSGGLGLVRIWAESDLTLRLVLDDDEVEIQAQGRIRPDDDGAPAQE